MPRSLTSLVLGISCVFFIACSRQAGTLEQGVTLPPDLVESSQLPSVDSLRSSSILVSFTRSGYDTFLRSGNASDEGFSLRLASPQDGISWAIWGFGEATGSTECIADFNGENDDEVFFAIANFQTGRWDIGGPAPGPQQVADIDNPAYFSPLGNFYIAMIAYDTQEVLVSELALLRDVEPFAVDLGEVGINGGFPSLQLVNGRPAISYYDDVTKDLKYVRANDAFGASWPAAVTVDSTGDTGQYCSLAMIESYPAIAYYDASQSNLRFAIAEDAAGSSWQTPVTVDGATRDTGKFCSLQYVNGYPAISYFDDTDSELRYVRASDAGGTAWDTPLSVDNAGNTGQDTCLAIVNGVPAISYRDGGAGTLRYVHASDNLGDSWGLPLILASGNNTGFSSSLVLVSGIPAIAFYDGTDGDLIYIMAQDSAGDVWGSPLTLAGFDDASGDFCSMAYINGFPYIAYYNGLFGDLRFVRSSDSLGQAWTEPVILDESSVVTGKDPSIADIGSVAAVAYFDQTNSRLRYMWGFGE